MLPVNELYCGDNLEILREYIAPESVDLVYLDPPFKSDQNYNLLFREKDGSRSRSQILAFEDTWEWNREAGLGRRYRKPADPIVPNKANKATDKAALAISLVALFVGCITLWDGHDAAKVQYAVVKLGVGEGSTSRMTLRSPIQSLF
jgi:hypothetical protein